MVTQVLFTGLTQPAAGKSHAEIHLFRRIRVWWLLSNFMVVPSQQYWFEQKLILHACIM